MGYLLEVIGEEEEVEAPNLKHEIRNEEVIGQWSSVIGEEGMNIEH